MKKLLIIVFSSFLLSNAAAQELPSDALIKGTVVDSIKKVPVDYATVLLIDVKTGKPVKSALSRNSGTFEFKNVEAKHYKLSVALVGYQPKIVSLPGFSPKEKHTVDIGTIYLSPAITNLKEVTVTAAKPIVKQEVDRIAYDVQADPEKQAITVLDMLRKVPLVSVDASDNIKLKGSSNYKILINGKPSALIARNPSDVFKSMPAENIERIEVITTPPAKYDAEGLSGIINIITKKKIDEGYNGSLSANYNTVNGPGTNLNCTVKKGKIGVGGYAGLRKQKKQTNASGYSNETFSPVKSFVSQEGYRTVQNDNLYGSAELSFEIDSLNLITGNIEHYNGTFDQNANQLSQLFDSGNIITQSFRQLNDLSNSYHSTDLGLNYQLGFRGNKDRLLTGSYQYSSSANEQSTDAAFIESFSYGQPDFQQYNNSGTREHTVQLDYVHPVKKLNIEAGIKAILRDNYSDFRSYNRLGNGSYVPDPSQTNNFDYNQDVYSIYNSYQLKMEKWVVKAGARLERTRLDADFVSLERNLKRSYNNLIPSASVQRTLDATNNLTLGYSERIQRPGIWELNPFTDKSNPKFINTGNPDLNPVLNRSIELNYSNFRKGSVNIGLNYTFANNTVENVTTLGPDTVSTTTYLNVGRKKGLGLTLNTSYPLTKKANISVNSELLHVWLKGTYNGRFYDNTGFQGHIFANSSYKFEKGFSAGVDVGFDSRYVLLQGKDNYYFSTSASVTKSFLKEKFNASFAVNNPFNKYRRVDFYTTTTEFRQSNFFDMNFRRINFRLSYKFGNQNSSVKKNERGINNDDVNNSRGGR